RDRGAVLKAVPLRDDGTLDLEAFERLLTRRTRVVAFAHVSNVLGTINPVAEMSARARQVGAFTVVDGAQAAPHLPLDISLLGCDFYVFSAHKMLGPTGIGVLYGRREGLESLEPGRGGSEMIKEVWIDRAQWNDLPWRFEPGTPPIAEAVGLTAAIEYLEKLGMERVLEHERASRSAARPTRSGASSPSSPSCGRRSRRRSKGVSHPEPRDAFVSPRFGQVATFMLLPAVATAERLDVALVGIPYDGGVSYRTGARFGPRAVREQSSLIRPWHPVLKVHPFERLRVADCGDVDVVPISIERTYAAIER